MLTTIRQLYDLLDPVERRRLALLLCMVLMMGLLNTAGVASLLPFLAILSNPDLVHESRTLGRIYGLFGFDEPQDFLIYLGVFTFVLIFFGQIFNALTTYVLMRFSMLREYTFGTRLLACYLNQPYAWFLTRNSSDLGKSILAEVAAVVDGVLIPERRALEHLLQCH